MSEAPPAVETVLEVDRFALEYPTTGGWLRALDDVSFTIGKGRALGLVGESGSGKSTTALAVMGLLAPEARIAGGRILFCGKSLLDLPPEERRALRGERISMVFQDPFTSLNPGLQVGRQIAEPLVLHRALSEGAAAAEARRLLDEVGIPRPEDVARAYPHQLSGGMKQRALIATALACSPELLVLDEPTTALDVTIEAQILDLLERLRRDRGLSMLYITHNLGVVSRICDDVCVLYAGRVAESGPAASVLDAPKHPYTKGLLASLPRVADRQSRLAPIPGRFPDLSAPPSGCIFHPRCHFALERCATDPQVLEGDGHKVRCWRAGELEGAPWPAPAPLAAESRASVSSNAVPLVETSGLARQFQMGGVFDSVRFDWSRGGFPLRFDPPRVKAVDGVSIRIAPGEVLGLVGESGCGKSTLGRMLVRLIDPSDGSIRIAGEDVARLRGRALHEHRRIAQIIFQNPDSSLNPRKTMGEIVARPLVLFDLASGKAIAKRVAELLDLVRLPASYADRYPHQLSGGEKQRVGIARALATEPRFIVCDEAVSALDVSVQAYVLNVLADLRDRLNVAYLFISHDLSVIAHIADRVAVMYRGAIVEEGPAADVLQPPYHPYTEALLSAIPEVGRATGARIRLRGDAVERDDAVRGCRFQHRCPRKVGPVCETETPPWQSAGEGHRIACHIPMHDLRRLDAVSVRVAAQAV